MRGVAKIIEICAPKVDYCRYKLSERRFGGVVLEAKYTSIIEVRNGTKHITAAPVDTSVVNTVRMRRTVGVVRLSRSRPIPFGALRKGVLECRNLAGSIGACGCTS